MKSKFKKILGIHIFMILNFCDCNSLVFGQSKAFFLGHSLINFNVPNMTNRLAEAANKDFVYKRNIGNGANLLFHHTNPFSPGSQGDVWKTTMPQGGFTDFIFTEAVPLKGHLQWSKTYEYADSFATYFRKYNTDSRIFLYETWHCIKSGTPEGCEWEDDDKDPWTTRLKNDHALWKGIVNHLKTKNHKDVYLIPAGQAFIKLDEEIRKGNLPEINNVFDLFSDDIHLTNIGNYFIACLMYGAIFKETPLGLPSRLKDEYEVLYSVFPTNEQAKVLQDVAWQTICESEISGVNCSITQVEELPKTLSASIVFEQGKISFDEKFDRVEIFSLSGQRLSSCIQCEELALPFVVSSMNIVKMIKGPESINKLVFIQL
ncbi:MAG: hypothetical protein RLZZ546_3187 [Bacteroidota bacterium]|jgi:hypothetical protein